MRVPGDGWSRTRCPCVLRVFPCGRERVCMHVSIGFDMEEAGATVQIDQDIRHMMSDRVSA